MKDEVLYYYIIKILSKILNIYIPIFINLNVFRYKIIK